MDDTSPGSLQKETAEPHSVKHLTCWFWHNAGQCKWASQCRYSHTDTGLYANKPQVHTNGRSVAGKNAASFAPRYRRWQGTNLPGAGDARYGSAVEVRPRSASPVRDCTRHDRPGSQMEESPSFAIDPETTVRNDHCRKTQKPFESQSQGHGRWLNTPPSSVKLENTSEETAIMDQNLSRQMSSSEQERNVTAEAQVAGTSSLEAPRAPLMSQLDLERILGTTAVALLANPLPNAQHARHRPGGSFPDPASFHVQGPPQSTDRTPSLSETLLRLQTTTYQSPLASTAVAGPSAQNQERVNEAVRPITLHDYNALHASVSSMRAQLATGSAPPPSNNTEVALIHRIDALNQQLEAQRRYLVDAHHLLSSGSTVLANQGRHAMDLSRRLQVGAQLDVEFVGNAYLNSTHLMNEAEAFHIAAHEWSMHLPESIRVAGQDVMGEVGQYAGHQGGGAYAGLGPDYEGQGYAYNQTQYQYPTSQQYGSSQQQQYYSPGVGGYYGA